MSVFIDTNVLVRLIEVADPMHDAAVGAIAALIRTGEVPIITPQIGAEFWNVVTRPRDRNGIGLLPDAAGTELARIEGFLTVVAESTDVIRHLERASSSAMASAGLPPTTPGS